MKLVINKGKKKTYYKIPNEWNELTLGKYMGVMKVIKQEGKNDTDQMVNVLHSLTEIPRKNFYMLDIGSINKLGAHLTEFINTQPNRELKHFIEIEGVEYGFHPCLKDMTLGEFVDLETYMKDVDDNLHKVLSILYRPVIAKEEDKYAIQDYEPNEEQAELFKKHLKVEDFNGASVFFYNLEKELAIGFLKFLRKNKNKKENMELIKTLSSKL